MPVGGRRQTREDIAQVSEGIDSAPAAAFDDGVEDGAAFPGLCFTDEQPVFLAEGGGALISSARRFFATLIMGVSRDLRIRRPPIFTRAK